MSLSPKQRTALLSILDDPAQVHLLHGAVRSGKTMTSILAWCEFVRTAPPGALMMVGKTKDTIRRNVLDEIDAYFGKATPLVHTAGANEGRLFGRKIHVVGANDAKAESRVRGMTLSGSYVDELTLLPNESFWHMLTSRHLTVAGSKIIATTNPDAPRHWVKTAIIDNPEAGANSIHFEMADNPMLNQDRIEAFKKTMGSMWWRRFGLGLWVAAEGAIFEDFDEDTHVIPHADVPEMDHVLAAGVDYGSRKNARAVLIGVGTGPDGIKRLYIFDEWAPPNAALSHHSKDFIDWLGQNPEPDWVYYDPAAKVFGDQIFNDGVSNAVKASNDVLPGIRVVDSLIASDRLRISDRCEHLIRELPGYTWDPKGQALGEDRPLKVDDHSVDALRYALMSTQHTWRSLLGL